MKKQKKPDLIRLSPESSNIQAMAYNPTTKSIRVIFNNGLDYSYKNVPESVWVDALKAKSVGKFVNAELKGKYESEKLS